MDEKLHDVIFFILLRLTDAMLLKIILGHFFCIQKFFCEYSLLFKICNLHLIYLNEHFCIPTSPLFFNFFGTRRIRAKKSIKKFSMLEWNVRFAGEKGEGMQQKHIEFMQKFAN